MEDKIESMFEKLQKINQRPEPFQYYTRQEFWNDEHISRGLLECHLDPENDWASRNKAFTDKSIAWILEYFKINNQSSIIDFGCGPGKYTTPFAEAGATVTGIDFSERSIRHAKKVAAEKGLKIDYFLQDYLGFQTDQRFDLITMIWCDFSALSPGQRSLLLGKFRELLSDDGSILLDVDSMERFRTGKKDGMEYKYYPGSDLYSPVPHYVFTTWHSYEEEKVLLQKDTVIEEEKEQEIFHWAQCFSLQSLKDEFEANGLQVVESWSDVAGSPYSEDSPVFAVVARRAR